MAPAIGRHADAVGMGRAQVVDADTFWLSTVRPDGRPHVTPLIAVWHGDAIWFTTGPDERKAMNLADNPSCVLTIGRSDLAEGAFDVVLEGAAEHVTDEAELTGPEAQADGRSGPFDLPQLATDFDRVETKM